MKLSIILLFGVSITSSHGFVQQSFLATRTTYRPVARRDASAAQSRSTVLCMTSTHTTPETDATSQSGSPPILLELRDVAMKLHTKEQAPREGQAAAPEKPTVPFAPTQMDYLKFLVDSYEVSKQSCIIMKNNTDWQFKG